MSIRRMWKSVRLAAVVLCSMLLAQAASAAVVYDYITDKPDYSANAGDTVNVAVYLRELVDGGSSSVINSDGGLFGAGFTVLRQNGDASLKTAAADVGLNTTDFAGLPAIAGHNGQGSPSASEMAITQSISISAPTGVKPGNTGGGAASALSNAVYLGTIHIVAGQSNSTFALKPYNTTGGNTITNNNFLDLDFDNASPAFTGVGSKLTTFTVSVPEPASIGLLVGLAGYGLIRRRRMA
jgi:hypothetical protein